MVAQSVDVVVVGMGPGGEDLASKLAVAGLSVVGIDQRLLGGECPYFGCVPSKMMIRASDVLAEGRRIPQLAGDSTVTPDFTPVAKRIRQDATDDWDDTAAVERFQSKGGVFVRGHGVITGPNTVSVGGDEYIARRGIVLNTGTEPNAPAITGLEGTPYWTNREAMQLETLPASIAILGGGAIGSELSQVFARFGVKVTVIEAAPRLLRLEEPESGELVEAAFREDGIDVLTGAAATAVSHDANGFTVTLENGATVQAERLLVACGRRSNLKGIGLDKIGLDENVRHLDADEYLRVAEGVWAIGDIVGKGAFTHMSMYQAAIATRDILGHDGAPARYHAVPRVTFTDPEVGSVGLTEQQAREQGISVRVGRQDLPVSSRGWIHKAGNAGIIKLVADEDRGVLVGATSVGPNGGEVLSALVLAVHAAVPVAKFREMIFAYPTFHRAIEAALDDMML
ncbi:MAG TPA: NAD(P)/FAD-dependent oxidoreductase [Pseudonocardiaceae bacterium]|nr:NAD(P)/FAD-dependent oxidoreductase [Pseudonocardiaceae bacterium]